MFNYGADMIHMATLTVSVETFRRVDIKQNQVFRMI